MRKFLLIGLTLLLLGTTGLATAATKPTTTRPPSPQNNAKPPSSYLNDIEVPFEVIMAIQDKYQGFAATEASKTKKDGKDVYRLRVDKDDNPAYDGTSFYLLYDMSWKEIGKDNVQPPPKPKTEAAQSTIKQETEKPQAPKPEGGRGSGDTQDANTGTTTTQSADPQPAPTDGSGGANTGGGATDPLADGATQP